MKELFDFENYVDELSLKCNRLQEGHPVIDSADFGGQRNLQDRDVKTGLTYLEEIMAELVGDVMVHGVSEAKAVKEVKIALDELIEMNALGEVPTEGSSDGAKAMFAFHARPKIRAHLKLKGIRGVKSE